MKPFAGYNFGDYFAHWLSFGAGARDALPKIFHVNWFRKDADGRFLWPGFGDNLRVLEWMLRRVEGSVGAVETPIGRLPRPGDIDAQGLDIPPGALEALLEVDAEGWRRELAAIGEYLGEFGERTPPALLAEQQRVAAALEDAKAPA